MSPDSLIDTLISLVDWMPDTVMDSVAVMLLAYAVVMVAVMEALLWRDRREVGEP